MALGKLPPLTRGPMAMFYGGEQIMADLSEQSAGNHFAIFCTASVVFQVSMLIFKSLKMRRISTRKVLREAIVSNFLNVFNLFVIISVTAVFTLYVIFYYVTINNNLERDDAWRNLLLMALLETAVQITPFCRNIALR